MDLFSSAQEADASAPLAARMRPRTLDEYVGQQHLVGPGGAVRRAIETGVFPSIDPFRISTATSIALPLITLTNLSCAFGPICQCIPLKTPSLEFE